jgi:hypothetical protein
MLSALITEIAAADCPSFPSNVTWGAGDQPGSVAIGDLDGDGDPDLAVANGASHNVSVMLNNGDGAFAPHVTFGVGRYPYSIAIGDLDRDGDPDLAVANQRTDDVSVLINDCEPKRGDMNCDGAVDIGDVDPFVTALIGEQSYEEHYPDCDYHNADINADGSVDFNDIDGFVECLINGGCE